MERKRENEVIVRAVEPGDSAAWREMWRGYNTFYGVTLPENVSETTWKRILDPASMVNALLATDAAGNALGFANYVLHPYTWGEGQICYLEDLFVRPEARGQGAGRALIEALIQLSQERGWDRLYWVTHEDNTTARKLYDSFGKADDYVRYVLAFNTLA